MIRVDIKDRMNITMLAKAYTNNLLPMATGGEAFYSNDERGEIKYIYFLNKNYYSFLINSINLNMHNFLSSNASRDWSNLFTILSAGEDIEDTDFGLLEYYDLVEPNYKEREIDLKIIDSYINSNTTESSDTFYRNVKRLYKGYEVTYRGNKNFVVILTDLSTDIDFKLDINPLLNLTKIHNLIVKKLEIHRIPFRKKIEVRVGVEPILDISK